MEGRASECGVFHGEDRTFDGKKKPTPTTLSKGPAGVDGSIEPGRGGPAGGHSSDSAAVVGSEGGIGHLTEEEDAGLVAGGDDV